MKRFYRHFPAVALLLAAGAAAAQSAVPLVVIRFNQPRIYYDQQLYGAVSQAVAKKPDVMFDIVSSAPSTGDSSRDEQWVATASRNTQSVVATMQSMGVPMERMRIRGQAQPGIKFDETQIFVR